MHIIIPSLGDWSTLNRSDGLLLVDGHLAELLHPELWDGCYAAFSHALTREPVDLAQGAVASQNVAFPLTVGERGFHHGNTGSTSRRYETDSIAHGIGSGDFLWSCWVEWLTNYGPGSNFQGICANGSFAPGMYVLVSSGQWGGYWGSARPSGSSLSLNTRYHLVMRRTGTTLAFYRDGAIEPTTYTVSTSMANNILKVGSSGDNNVNHADIYYEDVRCYNVAGDARLIENLAREPNIAYLARPLPRVFLPPAGGSTFTATVSVTTGAATLAASATHTAPVFTATAALTTGGATCSASATHTTPTYTAAAALTAGGATCSASATHTTPTYSASADLTSGAATLQASAAFSAVIRTATADLGTGAATLASSATFSIPDRTATAALETGAATLTASATHVGPSYTATADLTTAASELSATATFFDPTSGPAPPSVASSSSNSSGTGVLVLTITAPSGIVQGEVGLAIFCWASGGPGTVTPPANWDLVYTSDHALSNMHIRAYRTVFGGSEPANYQWSWTTSVAVVGGILRLTGADPDTTIYQAADNDAGLNSGPVVCPSITTPWRQLIVRVVNLRGQHTDASPESGPTSRWNVFHSGSAGLRGAVFTQEQAASGATGTFTVTYTDTGTDQWNGATLAITSPVRSGTASLVAPPAALSASATHTAPMFSGSAALTTGAATVGAAASFRETSLRRKLLQTSLFVGSPS